MYRLINKLPAKFARGSGLRIFEDKKIDDKWLTI